MDGQIKYLVQVHCQTSPIGHEDRLCNSLKQSFDVRTCRATRGGLDIELQSGHPLAHGVFKDVADAVIQLLSELNAPVSSGVIYQADRGWWSSILKAVFKNDLDRPNSFAASIKRLIETALGGARLAPVFYFYRNVSLDLALNAKVAQMQQRGQMEPAVGLN